MSIAARLCPMVAQTNAFVRSDALRQKELTDHKKPAVKRVGDSEDF